MFVCMHVQDPGLKHMLARLEAGSSGPVVTKKNHAELS